MPTSGAPWSCATTSTSASVPRRGWPMPCQRGQEAGQRGGVDRLDLLAQRGERPAPELAEDVGVAPLALDAVGPELAAHDPAVALEHLEGGRGPVRRARP